MALTMSRLHSVKKYDLEDRTVVFAKNVRSFVKTIPKNQGNVEDAKQLIGSAGSVGANYIEANPVRAKIIDDISNYAEIKDTKDVASRFMIVDKKEMMFMLLDDKEVHPSYDVGVWVNTPFFAQSISNMFNMVYSMAKETKIKK